MVNSKTHIDYTANDIQKYLEGKMSNVEMHAIEKAALNDTLLAEAIEGFAGMDEKEWSLTLFGLRNKIASTENIALASIKNLQYRNSWKGAAAVLAIISFAAVAYFFTTHKDAVIIAEQHAKVMMPSDRLPGNIAADTPDQQLIKSDTERTFVIFKPKSPSELLKTYPKSTLLVSPQKEVASKTHFKNVPKSKIEENLVLSSGGVYNYFSLDSITAIAQSSNNNASGVLKKAGSSNINDDDNSKKLSNNYSDRVVVESNKPSTFNNSLFNNFSGVVVTKDNTPLAFAQLNISATKRPVYTDKNGVFKVNLTDTILQAEVISAGYESKIISFNLGGADMKVVLEPILIVEKNLSSGKVNVGAAGAKSRAEQKKRIDEQEEEDAVPVNGWQDYNNYLSNNGKLSDKNIHGVVEVFVNFDKTGAVSKIKVDKSLCVECDAEAVRLVKEGPRWEVKANKARKIKVKVKF